MPESEYPVRKLVELPNSRGVTEIMFQDVSDDGCMVGVVSSQGDDHVAAVHTLHAGKHCLVLLDEDDAQAMARRLLQLAADPDDKRARAALRRMIDVSTSPEQIINRLLEHFEVFPRAAE